MMSEQFTAKVIEHSISESGKEILTFQLRYPRMVHAEAKTHRVISMTGEEYIELTQDASFMSDPMLSRNASSSRAIPVAKMIEQVRKEPAMPVHWGKNQPGMQAREEHDEIVLLETAIEYDNPSDVPLFTFERTALTVQEAWKVAATQAADVAEAMAAAGYHKQVVNRLLEPFQFISVVVTATDWDNFFELRDHADADPTIAALARKMREAKQASTPVLRDSGDAGMSDGWHLPYITAYERVANRYDPLYLAKLSTARCARVSFLNHDGTTPNQEKDLQLFMALVGSEPLHASPTEHQGFALFDPEKRVKNLQGWHQFRQWVEEGIKNSRLDQYEGSTCD